MSNPISSAFALISATILGIQVAEREKQMTNIEYYEQNIKLYHILQKEILRAFLFSILFHSGDFRRRLIEFSNSIGTDTKEECRHQTTAMSEKRYFWPYHQFSLEEVDYLRHFPQHEEVLHLPFTQVRKQPNLSKGKEKQSTKTRSLVISEEK